MHGRSKSTTPAGARPATLSHATGAVTWIDSHHAIVVRTETPGDRSVRAVDIGLGGTVPYLARVVDEIGDRDRVVILGPDEMRVELEREYVSIFRRPDRLLDVEASGPADEAELRRRLDTLTAD